MKKIVSLILLVGCILSLHAQNNITPDAEYQLISRNYKVNNDGSMDITFRKELKVIRNRAITAYADKGETFIVYNPAFETLTINQAYTLLPNGRQVTTPKNAFVEQLPASCVGSERLSHLREMAVIHTALEPEAIIVLDYTIHRLPGSTLEEQITLTEDCPVLRSEVIVNLPNDMPFHLHERNLPKHAYSIPDDNTYHLVVLNIAQNYNEQYLPHREEIYPTVFFTNNAAGNRYLYPNEVLPVSATLRQQLHSSDTLTTIANYRNHVVDNIRLNNIPISLLQNKPATAQEVYNSNCGNIVEKAILLAAMLRGEGFEAKIETPQRSLAVQDEYREDVFYMALPERTHVIVTIGGIPYRVNVTDKSVIKPTYVAEDIISTLSINRDLAFNTVATPHVDGYYTLTLPTEPDAFKMNAAALSSNRQAPVKVKPVEEMYRYTIALPAGVKMVNKSKKVKKSCAIGRLEVEYSQEGNTLTIYRYLTLTEPIVKHSQYKKFREMMIQWQALTTLQLKTE